MTKQVINVGSAANDGTGDTLRAASQKINANFTEVYTTAQLAYDAANTKVAKSGDTISIAGFTLLNISLVNPVKSPLNAFDICSFNFLADVESPAIAPIKLPHDVLL